MSNTRNPPATDIMEMREALAEWCTQNNCTQSDPPANRIALRIFDVASGKKLNRAEILALLSSG
ncbi:hypothetical protein BLJAPNOD_05770 [Ensifer sp. M14]|uniref:hypothetical protein n=1 Tax=Sinorhizobium/Ensifer group TaxID=227292 RepID=UPI00098575DA|nr:MULTISPECIES: hypothetical protein [Sinorhizobium/Ensifer group]OOG71220.1 hypothetical protein B0E45_11050 [Sinorhizobium sp. A49]RDL46934.1 hypothetical protein BLJAPNOD_05770 [Ensifer sp. M14]